MKLKLFLAVAVTLAVAAACDSDTFTSDAGGDDAGTDVPPIGGEGGSSDGSVTDAKVGPTRYCDTQDAQFCADFDIPGDAGAGFEAPALDGGWALDFQSTLVHSAPDAVEVDV